MDKIIYKLHALKLKRECEGNHLAAKAINKALQEALRDELKKAPINQARYKSDC